MNSRTIAFTILLLLFAVASAKSMGTPYGYGIGYQARDVIKSISINHFHRISITGYYYDRNLLEFSYLSKDPGNNNKQSYSFSPLYYLGWLGISYLFNASYFDSTDRKSYEDQFLISNIPFLLTNSRIGIASDLVPVSQWSFLSFKAFIGSKLDHFIGSKYNTFRWAPELGIEIGYIGFYRTNLGINFSAGLCYPVQYANSDWTTRGFGPTIALTLQWFTYYQFIDYAMNCKWICNANKTRTENK